MSSIHLALTEKGKALMAKINKGDGAIPLDITRVVTASGYSAMPLELNDVVDHRQTMSIVSKSQDGPRATIHVFLSNQGNPAQGLPPVATGYNLRQIGMFAIDPDEGEILFRISQFEHPNYVPAAREMGWSIGPKWNFVVGNASEVTVVVDPAGMATVGLLQEHIDKTSAGGVHGIKTENGRLMVLDESGQWRAVSSADDIAAHDASASAHESRFSRAMPLAPTGAVHGAVGGRWEALEGTELRAVHMVSEDVGFTLSDTRHIEIPKGQFDRFDVFHPTVNGATVRIEKEPMKQTLYAVGRDFGHYAFDYDGESMRIAVRQLGIAASNPNILHNWDFRNPVNQRGLTEYVSNGSVYCIDRWRFGSSGQNAKVSLLSEHGSGFLRFLRNTEAANPTFVQVVEFPGPLIGKTVTASAIARCSAGAAVLGVRRSETPEWTLFTNTFLLTGTFVVVAQHHLNTSGEVGSFVDIQSVKLEAGPASTLANDPPMDFGRELAVCQRFQRLLSWPGGRHFHARATNLGHSAIMFHLPTGGTFMRIEPRIVNLGELGIRVLNFPANTAEAGFSFFATRSGMTSVRIDATKAAHGLTDAYLDAQGVLLDANL